jgi:HSP90 family molecular chaperone
LVKKLKTKISQDVVKVLFDQAVLSEGGQLKEEHDCVANSGHGFGLLQKWGEVKPVNAISTLM